MDISDNKLCLALFPYRGISYPTRHGWELVEIQAAKEKGWVDYDGSSVTLTQKGGKLLSDQRATVSIADKNQDFAEFLESYLKAEVCWAAGLSDYNDPESEHYVEVPEGYDYDDVDNLHPSAVETLSVDALRFFLESRFHINRGNFDRVEDNEKWSQAGHDFALTRNGHGCGFWESEWCDSEDEDEESTGRYLTSLSEKYGRSDLTLGDDCKIYAN